MREFQRAAKTPAQTAAYEQFEIARDAFRQRLYLESLESLDKAISGDHTSPGYKLEWRFHQLIGIIRLGFDGCDVDLVDPGAAERAFLSAARYARADYPKEAARALMSAGWAAFVQQKLPEAVRHTQAALGLDPQLGEALFQAAQLQMVAGKPDAALPMLRRAIELDRGYLVRAAGDPEFQRHGEALDAFLTALRQERLADLQRQIQPHYAEIESLLPRSSELADHPTVKLWQNLLAGGAAVVLTDLLALDVPSDANAIDGLVEHLRDQVHFRMELVDVVREVEEVYSEEVVVRAAGWFRSEVKETVQRRRTVLRDAREGRAIFVNWLGEHSGRAAPSPLWMAT